MLMGNAGDRRADSPEAAVRYVRAFVADLPRGQPCTFMTSAPPDGEKAVRPRQRALDDIAAAFAMAGMQCAFVPGFTPATVRENQGSAANVRRKASGRANGPDRSTEPAAHRFPALRRPALCRAMAARLAPRGRSRPREAAAAAVTGTGAGAKRQGPQPEKSPCSAPPP